MIWMSGIMLVFLVGWGVAQYALLFPHSAASPWLVRDLITLSYWQMHTELYAQRVIQVSLRNIILYIITKIYKNAQY